MTKELLVVCVTLAVCFCATTRPPVSDTALDDALNDKRFIQRQLKCALGEVPCDPIGKRLKSKADYSNKLSLSKLSLQALEYCM